MLETFIKNIYKINYYANEMYKMLFLPHQFSQLKRKMEMILEYDGKLVNPLLNNWV